MSYFYFLKHKYNSEEEARRILEKEVRGRFTYSDGYEEVNFVIDYNNSFGGKGNNDKTKDFINTYCHGNESEFWDIVLDAIDDDKAIYTLSPAIKYDEFHKEDAIIITTTYKYNNKYPMNLYIKIYNLFGEERSDKWDTLGSTKDMVYVVAYF